MANRYGYRWSVEWIALNDEPECLVASDVQRQVTVLLLADMYSKAPLTVACDIVRKRMKLAEQEREPLTG